MPTYLAVDLGAESGRVLAGRLVDGRLTVTEAHRFANRPVLLPDGLHWNVLGLYADLTAGLARAAEAAGGRVDGIGVDAWGNDFALLDRAGGLVSNPWHYRDRRTEGMPERVAARVGAAELYRVTGTPGLPINTSSQLLAMEGSPLLDAAERLAMLPDLFTYWLTGTPTTERTIASTTQLFDARRRCWATEVIGMLGLPARLFDGEVVAPGTPVGTLRPGAVDGVGPVGVTAVAGHDTASAVAGIPARGPKLGYICSGTWSLVGLELASPILSEDARRAGFSNEAGVDGTVRFLRNGTGLWLLQRCREAWRTTGDAAAVSYAALTRAAATVRRPGPLVDPDDPRFLSLGDMPGRIRGFCRETGQAEPADRSAMVRCILDSLACRQRWTLERAEALAGWRAEVVHIVGGGAENPVLCQLTADVTGRPVLAGPTEATGVGNLLMQARADGQVGSLAELRDIVRRSLPPQAYTPGRGRAAGGDAYARFLDLLGRGDDA